MQGLIKSTPHQTGNALCLKKNKTKKTGGGACVFAQRAVNVYFYIYIETLSEFFGGGEDKVTHLICLFCLFSNIVSVSDVCVLAQTDCVTWAAQSDRLYPSVRWRQGVEWGGGSAEGGKKVKENERGVVRVSIALSREEMTELTQEPCHILFSASLSSVGLRTEKGC